MNEPPSGPRVDLLGGREVLVLHGVVQSVAALRGAPEPADYWPLLLPDERPDAALLLGLGGCTVAWLLHRRYGQQARVAMTGVEIDPAVLALARSRGWLDVPGLASVQGEAAAYVAACAVRRERFDLVTVDLFGEHGIPPWVTARRFLTAIRGVLASGGVLTLNLSRGQGHQAHLRRLGRQFTVERVRATGMNLVVHARPLPRRRYVMK